MKEYILVTAEKFGYGPIITCLNIIHELKKIIMSTSRNEKLIFLGTSIAKEQAEVSKLFDEIIECETYNYNELNKFKKLFTEAKAVLCSENQFGAIYAKKLNIKNVYFIDNLVWMWDKITEGLEDVDGYFISETFSSKENFNKIGKDVKHPIFVGPLRVVDTNNYEKLNKLIINFGGAESFMLEKSLVESFYLKILQQILIPEIINKFDRIIVCGGSGIINYLNACCPKYDNVNIKTLGNDEYIKELHECSHIIMSSGLGNFIESVGISKNILYIPPINYSQLLQLNEYKKLDFGFEQINWDQFPFYKNIPNLLDEETGVNMVVENVKKFLADSSNILQEKVVRFINGNDQQKYFNKRRDYASKFSNDAAKIIVETVLKGIDYEYTK